MLSAARSRQTRATPSAGSTTKERESTPRAAPAVLVALRVAAYQILFLDRVPAHAAVNDAVRKVEAHNQSAMSGLASGLNLPAGFKMPF